MRIKKTHLLPEAPLNTIIHVDRSVRSLYPDWMRNVMRPDLEAMDGTRDRRVLVQRGRRTRRNAMAIARHSSHSELQSMFLS